MVLSLQGCMAVGKTTAARYVQAHMPCVHVCYEDNDAVIRAVRERGLCKDRFEDYVEIQRLWLCHEMDRYREAAQHACSVMDFGAEEIVFYTLHYPRTVGKNWKVEEALAGELEAVRACMPDRILFLDAPDDVLLARKQGDLTRDRTFFDHYLARLLPLKKQWLLGQNAVDVLRVGNLSMQETGERVKAWVKSCMEMGTDGGP